MLNSIRTAIDALFNSEPNYFRSIFGDSDTWIPPYEEYSEYSIANPNELLKFFKYTSEISLPPFLFFGEAAFKPFIPDFLRPIFFFELPEAFTCNGLGNNISPDESWFFINGVGTNKDMATLNGNYLADLFGTEITILHNPTDSLGLDLLQSMTGKKGDRNVDFALFAMPYIETALQEKKKVVLIAHSQGTLLASTILDILIQRKNKHLGKLEIYAFANCAEEMSHEPIEDPNQIPHIESFANEHDLVAKLGMLAPYKEERNIKIDGEHFIRKDAWGHFFNIHYLKYFKEGDFKHESNPRKKSRLFSYLKK